MGLLLNAQTSPTWSSILGAVPPRGDSCRTLPVTRQPLALLQCFIEQVVREASFTGALFKAPETAGNKTAKSLPEAGLSWEH